jgi:Omp85 superfamily domain
MAKVSVTLFSFLFCLSTIFDSHNSARAQNHQFCNNTSIVEANEFKVRAVIIEGRWASQKLKEKVGKIVGIGQKYSPARNDTAIAEIKSELKQNEIINLNNGTFAASFIYPDICDVSDKDQPKQIDIVFYPYYVRIDLINTGNNILPVPHIKTPTFSTGVLPNFLASSPVVGVLNDRTYGTSLNLKTTIDLLNRSADLDKNADTLKVNLDARRSISQPFYNINTGVEYTRPDYNIGAISPNILVQYSNQFTPLGEGVNWREGVQIEGGIHQKLDQSFFKTYAVGSSARFSDHSYTPSNGSSTKNSEAGLNIYAIGDSRIGDGFARFGAWLDGGFPIQGSSYQRLAAQGGYSTELGAGHDTVGLEVMAGSGYAWGNPPEYSRFFGGSSSADFLHESLNSTRVKAFPLGPTLRSFGEQQAGLRGTNGLVSGGNFYWNLNLKLAFPIAGWSQPLIPNEVVADPTNEEESMLLPALVKRSISISTTASIQAIERDLIKRGYPKNKETTAMARKVFDNEIIPSINYLTDRANLYSIKPILLFDVAQISGSDGGSNVWAGIGGGVQINVVNGRLETGYMQTIAPATDSSNGSFFLRFLFQDFF